MEKTKINSFLSIDFQIQINLTKGEAEALSAIVGYNINDFLEIFYKHLGKSYLQPHEKEMKNLFEKLKKEIPNQIYKINQCSKAINLALDKL